MSNNFTVSVVGEFKDQGATEGLQAMGQAAQAGAQATAEANQSLVETSATAAESVQNLNSVQQDSAQTAQTAAAAANEMAQSQAGSAGSAEQAAQAQAQLAAQTAAATQACQKITEIAENMAKKLTELAMEGLSLANTFEQTAERLSNMGLSAQETSEQMEVMRKMSYDTGTSMSDLAQASEIVARSGGDVRDQLSEINILATATGKSVPEVATVYSQAAQGLSRGILMLTKQFGVSKKDLAEYGAEIDENGNILAKNAEQQKKVAEALKEVVNVKYADAIAKHSESLQGAYDDLGSTLQRLKADFGASLAPVVETLANSLTKILKLFEEMPSGLRTTAETATALTAAFVALGKAKAAVNVVAGIYTGLLSASTAATSASTAATTANTAATSANSAAQTASVGSLTKASAAWGKMSTSILASSGPLGAMVGPGGVLAIIATEIAAVTAEIAYMVKVAKETNAEWARQGEDVAENAKKLAEGKNAYKELGAEIEKFGLTLQNRRYSATEVGDFEQGGLTASKFAEYERRQQDYATAMTRAALDDPENAALQKQAEKARQNLKNLEGLKKSYEEVAKARKKAAAPVEEEQKETEPTKTAEQIQQENNAAIIERAELRINEIEKEREKSVEKQGKARLEAVNASLQAYNDILRDDKEISENAQAREKIEDKINTLAQERQKIEQEILEARTDSKLETLEENRAKVVEKRGKSEVDSYTTALQKCKEILRNDSQISKNAEARKKVEEKILDYTKKRQEAEEKIAQIRKEAEQDLQDSMERYDEAKKQNLEEKLEKTTSPTERKELQAEIDKIDEKQYFSKIQKTVDEYNEKLKGMNPESVEYRTTKNAMQYDLQAMSLDRERELMKKTSEQTQNFSSSAFQTAQTKPAEQEKAATSAEEVATGLDNAAKATENFANPIGNLGDLDISGVSSAFSSLQTAATGAAGALLNLASSAKSQSSASNSYNFSINSQSSSLNVNEKTIVSAAANEVDSMMSQREQFNGFA